MRPSPTLQDVAKKHFVRREPCPTCRKGVVVVTYEQVTDGSGNVTLGSSDQSGRVSDRRVPEPVV